MYKGDSILSRDASDKTIKLRKEAIELETTKF